MLDHMEGRKADALRQSAKLYGDATAGPILPPIEPVSFVSVYCSECEVLLTSQNHAHGLRCRYCVEREAGIKWANAHRTANHERKLRKAVNGAWEVVLWIFLAIAGAAVAGWAAGALAWQIGYRL